MAVSKTKKTALFLLAGLAAGTAVFLPLQLLKINLFNIGITLSALSLGLVAATAAVLLGFIATRIAFRWQLRKKTRAQRDRYFLINDRLQDEKNKNPIYKYKKGYIRHIKHCYVDLTPILQDEPTYTALRLEQRGDIYKNFNPVVAALEIEVKSNNKIDFEQVLRLISDPSFDPNLRHKNGHSAISYVLLHAERITNAEEIIRQLIAKGADVNQALKVYPYNFYYQDYPYINLTSPLLALIRGTNFNLLDELLEAGVTVPTYALSSLPVLDADGLTSTGRRFFSKENCEGLIKLLKAGAEVPYQLYAVLSLLVHYGFDVPEYYSGALKRFVPHGYERGAAELFDAIAAREATIQVLTMYSANLDQECLVYSSISERYLSAFAKCDLGKVKGLFAEHGGYSFCNEQIGDPKQGIFHYLVTHKGGPAVLNFLLDNLFFVSKEDYKTFMLHEKYNAFDPKNEFKYRVKFGLNNLNWLLVKIPRKLLDPLQTHVCEFLTSCSNSLEVKIALIENIFKGPNRKQLLYFAGNQFHTTMDRVFSECFSNILIRNPYWGKDFFLDLFAELKSNDLFRVRYSGSASLHVVIEELLLTLKKLYQSIDSNIDEIDLKATQTAISILQVLIKNEVVEYEQHEDQPGHEFGLLARLRGSTLKLISPLLYLHQSTRERTLGNLKTETGEYLPKYQMAITHAQEYYMDNCVAPIFNRQLLAYPHGSAAVPDANTDDNIFAHLPVQIRQYIARAAKPDFIDQANWDRRFPEPGRVRL